MLVTVIRSKVGYPVELPDGFLIRPYCFVEVTELPASFKPAEADMDGDGRGDHSNEAGALQKLVDSGLVTISQIQDIGHLMTQGTAENHLPVGTTGTSVPGAPQESEAQRAKSNERNKEFPDYYTENSRVGLLTPKQKANSEPFRPSQEDLMASKQSIAQLARGEDPLDESVVANKIKLASGAGTDVSGDATGDQALMRIPRTPGPTA